MAVLPAAEHRWETRMLSSTVTTQGRPLNSGVASDLSFDRRERYSTDLPRSSSVHGVVPRFLYEHPASPPCSGREKQNASKET